MPLFHRALGLTIATILIAISASAAPSLVAQEKFSRPGPADKPTAIRMAIVILDLDNVDGAAQSFNASVYYEMRWHDERLVREEPGRRLFKIHEIWTPRIILANERSASRTMPEIFEVNPDGEVTYTQRISGSFSQPLDFREFPFDTQALAITFVSTLFDQSEVKLVPDLNFSTAISDRLSIPNWRVLSTSIKRTPYKVVSTEIGQPALTFSFSVKRIPYYYLIFIVLPLIVVVAMSWVVFWIEATDVGTRIAIAMTSMLTLIAYRFAMSGELPKISYLTRMDILVVGSTLIVFLALLSVVTTSWMVRNNRLKRARAINQSSRYAFPLAFAALTGVSLVI